MGRGVDLDDWGELAQLVERVGAEAIELAGLQDEIEHEEPTAICACANDPACRMIHRKRRNTQKEGENAQVLCFR